MNLKLRNAMIAGAVGGGIIMAGRIISAQLPDVDIATTTTVMGLVVGGGIVAGLNAKAGNRRQPVASDAARQTALTFPNKPGTGYVVVLRQSRAVGSLGFDLDMDGVRVAQLMASQFVILPVAAGSHRLFADITRAPGKSAAEPLLVDITEGQVLFFETRTKMGLARTSVHLGALEDQSALRSRLARTAMIMPLDA